MFQQGSMHAYWPSVDRTARGTVAEQANSGGAKGKQPHQSDGSVGHQGGGITLGAFLLMAAMTGAPFSVLQEGFEAFDTNKDGFITLEVSPHDAFRTPSAYISRMSYLYIGIFLSKSFQVVRMLFCRPHTVLLFAL